MASTPFYPTWFYWTGVQENYKYALKFTLPLVLDFENLIKIEICI